tara:strand:+ start:145 stop:582 length:438 start_codon:yes stop_codon:yes gene_type:complete
MDELNELLENFTWNNYKDISDALSCFDDGMIDEEMMRQATLYSYYYGLMSVAKRQMNNESTALTHFASQLRKEAKNHTPGIKKLTAKDLDDLVFGDEDYRAKDIKLNDATFKYELLKGLVRSLEQKKDMLQQVSANKREEIKLYK